MPHGAPLVDELLAHAEGASSHVDHRNEAKGQQQALRGMQEWKTKFMDPSENHIWVFGGPLSSVEGKRPRVAAGSARDAGEEDQVFGPE